MAIERRNPLPQGRYWVDVPYLDGKEVAFKTWLENNRESVKVRSTQHTPVNPDTWNTPASDWYLFDVLEPVSWNGPGLPTIAAGVETKDDTVTRPEPEKDPIDELSDAVEDAKEAAKGLGKTLAYLAAAGLAVGIGLALKKR